MLEVQYVQYLFGLWIHNPFVKWLHTQASHVTDAFQMCMYLFMFLYFSISLKLLPHMHAEKQKINIK